MQGDGKYWSGRNPILFPVIGSTWDKKLHINGEQYDIGNHGFVRHADFKCTYYDSECIVMELKDNKATLEQYPFAFTMHVIYTIFSNYLCIQYSVINENHCVMPFNFGLHPAFNCPLTRSTFYDDYYIQFNKKETFKWLNAKETGALTMRLTPIDLDKTIVIHNPNSNRVTLTNGIHGVTVGFDGFEWLAFWSLHAPFVCIEPWFGHDDYERADVLFAKREGTILLEPHKEWKTEYTIQVF